NAGTVRDGITNALPVGTTLTDSGVLDLAGFNQVVARVAGTGTVTDSGAGATFTVNNAVADALTLTLTGANLSLAKSGAGTLTISNANTYGGSTSISAGTVADGVANALPVATSLAINGTLDLAGFDQTIRRITGNGMVTDSGSAVMFTVNNTI